MEITPEFIRDPYPQYHRMRETGAAHWSEANGGTWFVPRYDDVCSALLDPRLSSARKAEGFVNQYPPEARGEFAPFQRLIRLWIVLLDPPEHAKLRKLMNRGFVKDVLQGLRPRVEQVTEELLDAVQGESQFDFVKSFGRPLPARIISDLLGVGDEAREDFMRWSEDIVTFAGSLRPPIEVFRRAQDSLLAMIDYFGKLVPERRANKKNDLISLLLRAEEDGDILTPEQVLSNCAQLIFAGHETTRNLLSNGLHALLTHPGELEKLRADPSLMPAAVRELLRFESPLQFIRRVADRDMEIWGKQVKEGQGVVLMLGSANRDERAWAHPDRLDVTRTSKNHVAFGHGIHMCIGAALAQMEAEIGFAAVLRRLPRVQLEGTPPVRVMNPMLRGLDSLVLRS